MIRAASLIVVVIFCFGFAAHGDELGGSTVLQIDSKLRRALENLNGRLELCEESVQAISDGVGKMSQSQLDFFATMARKHGRDDQKDYFVQQLLEYLCRTEENNCELRRRIAAIEKRNASIEKANAEYLARIRQLEREAALVAEQPTTTELLPPAARTVPAASSPPAYEVYKPAPGWRVDAIVRQRSQICPKASLIARCIDQVASDGFMYHGHLFLDCQRRQVLVMHPKTSVR